MLPQFISRVRTGVNRLFRWRGTAVSNNVVSDPVHLSSCLLDFWYTSVNGGSTDGRFLSWPNLAALPETWSAGSPGFLYKNPDGSGVYNAGAGSFTGTTRTLTGALTLYWLADYAGVDGVPLTSEVNGQFSISGTTANITNDAGTSKTKDGLLDGNRLYRWRRTSANDCFFKAGAGAEVNFGTLAGDISVSALLPITDDDANRTRRIVMYNVDLVEQSLNTGVEAAIVDVMNNQVTEVFTVTATWEVPATADLTKAALFEAYGAGGAGGKAGASSGGGGGGGGGYAKQTASSLTACGFSPTDEFEIVIDADQCTITDPNAVSIVAGFTGLPGSDGSGAVGGNGGPAGDSAFLAAAGYVGGFRSTGGNGAHGSTGGGGGGGGSGGISGNGVGGHEGVPNGDGAGGTVNFSGGHGYTTATSDGTNGATPGGGAGGGAPGVNSGNPTSAGAARAKITYYLNTTP